MANKLEWEMRGKSKEELIKICMAQTQHLTTWSEIAMTLAGYYYNFEPHADIWKNGTFVPNTMDMIRARARKALRSIPYKRATFILREESEEVKALPVDLLKLDEKDYKRYLDFVLETTVETMIKIKAKPEICTNCDGSGSIENIIENSKITCPVCKGTGG